MSGLCRNHSTFFSLSPIVEYLGYQKGLTLFCSEGGSGVHRARGAGNGMGKGRTGAWLGPTAQCHFLSCPFSRFQTLKGITGRGGREGPPPPPPHTSSPPPTPPSSFRPASCSLEGPRCLLPRAAPSAPRRCARPPAQPGGSEHWADCGPREPGGQLRPGCHLCAPGRQGRPGAARGGAAGTRPRRAPFKRCQGLIDEKWPRAGANLSPEAAGWRAGARGGAAA